MKNKRVIKRGIGKRNKKKEINMNRNILANESKGKPFSMKIIKFAIAAILLFALIVAITVSHSEIKDILTKVAELNITISVGVGALSIGFAKNKMKQRELGEFTIAIILAGLLTFLVAQIPIDPCKEWAGYILFGKKVYLFINLIYICRLLYFSLNAIQGNIKK